MLRAHLIRTKWTEAAATAIGMLLKCSAGARQAARMVGFFGEILSELSGLHQTFGMACSEFILRHGEAKVLFFFYIFRL